ncbi:MAG: efflux RND transporter periplasmic adaptor subunit, partial [Gammaproteobacteria bacterium]
GFELAGTVAEVFVEEGDRVDGGDRLARLDDARLQARLGELEAGLAQARADLELARATLVRVEAAAGFEGVSEQEVDQARQRVASLEAALALADSRLASVRVDLAKSRLAAPWDAVVVARRADEGQVVAPGQPVLSLVERAAPEVRVGVAGDTVPSLSPGQLVPVEAGGVTLQATVRAVLPVRDPRARTVDVILQMPADAPVVPGDLARLLLTRRIEAQGLWVPVGALAESSRGLWSVFVAEAVPEGEVPDGATHRLERRLVQIVHQEGDRAYVQGAIANGDLVAADGLQRVTQGQLVRVTVAE